MSLVTGTVYNIVCRSACCLFRVLSFMLHVWVCCNIFCLFSLLLPEFWLLYSKKTLCPHQWQEMFLFISLLSKFQLLHLRFDPLYMVRDRVCFLSSEYGYSVSQQQFLKTLPFLQFTHWLCFFYKSLRLAGVGSRCRRCRVAHTSPISESWGSRPGRTLIPAFGSCTPWQEAGAGLSTWASATHVGGLDFAPGFCFSLAYLRQASGGAKQQTGDWHCSLSASVSLSSKIKFQKQLAKNKTKKTAGCATGVYVWVPSVPCSSVWLYASARLLWWYSSALLLFLGNSYSPLI